jgi:hypothetical protein
MTNLHNLARSVNNLRADLETLGVTESPEARELKSLRLAVVRLPQQLDAHQTYIDDLQAALLDMGLREAVDERMVELASITGDA